MGSQCSALSIAIIWSLLRLELDYILFPALAVSW